MCAGLGNVMMIRRPRKVRGSNPFREVVKHLYYSVAESAPVEGAVEAKQGLNIERETCWIRAGLS
jgi:hypothetical protein